VGFTKNTAQNLTAMTQAIIDQKITPENHRELIRLSTPLEEYLQQIQF